ncbi:hypothetical protein CVT25_006321 [Psilocybe cyanescens]|uniref:Uncharacterized protein n=1 Tax=Psilocybe cyanescens TaxID=93625 RepID=A0A409X3V3_PSICY|nr:hypothetical protein CVT25_006321 [Psilocybe cyanescens]
MSTFTSQHNYIACAGEQARAEAPTDIITSLLPAFESPLLLWDCNGFLPTPTLLSDRMTIPLQYFSWSSSASTPLLSSSASYSSSSSSSPTFSKDSDTGVASAYPGARNLTLPAKPDAPLYASSPSLYENINRQITSLAPTYSKSTPLAPLLVIVIPESTIEEMKQAGLYNDPPNVDSNGIIPVPREAEEIPPDDQKITTSFPSGGEAETNYKNLSNNAGHCVTICSGAGGPVELVYSILNSDGSGEGDTRVETQRDVTRRKSPTATQKGKKHGRRAGPKYRVLGPEPKAKPPKVGPNKKTRIPVIMQGQAVKALPPSTDGLNFHCMAPSAPPSSPVRDEICQQSAFKVGAGINNAKFYNGGLLALIVLGFASASLSKSKLFFGGDDIVERDDDADVEVEGYAEVKGSEEPEEDKDDGAITPRTPAKNVSSTARLCSTKQRMPVDAVIQPLRRRTRDGRAGGAGADRSLILFRSLLALALVYAHDLVLVVAFALAVAVLALLRSRGKRTPELIR